MIVDKNTHIDELLLLKKEGYQVRKWLSHWLIITAQRLFRSMGTDILLITRWNCFADLV